MEKGGGGGGREREFEFLLLFYNGSKTGRIRPLICPLIISNRIMT